MAEQNRVVITQPTYLPWLGYFHLMNEADTFIFLDNVQFEKRSWQQRNKIKGPQGAVWLTVPVYTKGRFSQKINEVEIANQDWQKQHLNTIKHFYCKAPFYKETVTSLMGIYTKPWSLLVDLNLAVIHLFARKLGISPKFYLASELQGRGKRVDLLIDLCKKVGATHYLTGEAARSYIEENNLFPQYGITLEYHNFSHPVYPQLYGDFISHLSIIDTVMNLGWSETRELLNKGVKK